MDKKTHNLQWMSIFFIEAKAKKAAYNTNLPRAPAGMAQ